MNTQSKFHCEGSCKGESDKPGNCGAKDCELFGKPLSKSEEKDGCCGGTSDACACKCS